MGFFFTYPGDFLRRRPRKGFRPEVDKSAPRVNNQIRASRVLVIDEAGNKLGEFLTEDAISLAKDRSLDLIEVAPNSRPPVCKVGDYGKMKYEKKKKEAASRKTQTTITVKEIKLRPKTDQHDFDVKLNDSLKKETRSKSLSASAVVKWPIKKSESNSACESLKAVKNWPSSKRTLGWTGGKCF